MEMHWESLLEELWSYAASDPVELETKIRSSLKGHSSEGLLQAISLLVAQEQHATARTLLSEFLRNHQAADDIQQRLALILQFKKHRAPQMLSIKSKQRSRELLLKDVNELVASGKLQAAESLLLEAINTFEEADYLNLLSRVYMLQRLPIDEAKAMQRALLLRRQQQAFVEIAPEESTDDLPTDSDLAFLNDSAKRLATLECSTALAEVQQHEFNDSLKEEILDHLTELIDVEEILQQATKLGIDRTRERIDEALKQARTAAAKQRELFVHAATCDPNELRDELEITVEHLYSFVLGMFEQLGIEVAERSHKERLLRIRLSEQVMRDMGLSPKASPRMDVTLDRILAANRPDTHMLDLISKLMQYLLGKACEHDFGSLVAMLKASELGKGALLGAMLRWKGPQDNRMRQEFVAIQVNAGKTKLNSIKASQWLLTPAEHSTLTPDTEASKLLFKASEEMANQRLADASNRYLIPENLGWAAAGWTQQH